MLISNFAKRALKIGIILVVSLLAVEFLMTVFDPYFFKDRFENDPDLGFKVRAYYPTGLGLHGRADDGALTNQFGFNDRDYSLQKTPGLLRIVVVGDSFGWAGGLEDNYTAILERKFENRDGSHKIDVINTGYPGTHTAEQLSMLKKFALQYNPDLVVLGFFAGNDFFDADPNRKRIVLNKYFFDVDKRYELQLLGYPIVARSRLWLFLKNRLQSEATNAEANREGEEWAAATGQPKPFRNIPTETYLGVQRAKLEFFNRTTSAREFGAHTDYIFKAIDEMNELLKSKGIKFMVAIYPDEFQVSPVQFEALVEHFRLKKEDYDLDLAQKLLKTFLESKHISYLDMLDRFRTEENRRELYLYKNTHWNDAGNNLAADLLFQYLNAQPFEFNQSVAK
jgi:SGNH hydrolase-like domain, acetyltransferase AlgX